MADSFGNGNDGGGVNVKRLVATPAFLAVAAVAVVGLGYLWWKGRNAGNAAAQGGVVANPLTGPAQGPEVLSTLDTTGIQQQLSNLVAQVSTGQQSNTTPAAPTQQDITLTGGQTGLFSSPSFDPGHNLVTWLPGGTHVTGAGAPVQGGSFGQGNNQSNYWQPVQYEGETYYAWAPFTKLN
jgi:hypothetical protein